MCTTLTVEESLSAQSENVFFPALSDSFGFHELMSTIGPHTQDGTSYFFRVFQYAPFCPSGNVQKTDLDAIGKYRDNVVWRLLCLEDRVDAADRFLYWEILDALMDLSVQSAVRMLQNLYEYRVRKLRPSERKRQYPDISNDLYRLEYLDEQGGYRDVCVGTLLHEAMDLLQEEAERLIT